MGVRTKNRRKILVNDSLYVWYVEQDYDSEYHILNIISEDKLLILSCPLITHTPYIISKGNVFQNKKTDGRWNRYLLPFNVPQIITPKFVSEVILWAKQGDKADKVDWNGNNIVI